MSWWVYLEDRTAEPSCNYKDEEAGDERCNVACYPTVEVASHSEGGTYVMGGVPQAELNVTYNYGKQFWLAIQYPEGFREWLSDKRAGDMVPLLESAIEKLGTNRYDDYWAATAGNAGHALSILLGWAKQYPDAVFRVS